ncbi:MAG: PEP-CTERM sorting domain-containing protein [Leptolyngbyaceae cyanobacterium bins.302]|nr:PEP-CTERM sorting domain-containing protein [Leptolyngbyaceae cyanobacterium bins.302]
MFRKALGALIGISSVCAVTFAPAEAAQITVGSTTYEITTVTGTYKELEATLKSQVWWGSRTTAGLFAKSLGASLGFPDPPTAVPGFSAVEPGGPIFAFEFVPVPSLVSFTYGRGLMRRSLAHGGCGGYIGEFYPEIGCIGIRWVPYSASSNYGNNVAVWAVAAPAEVQSVPESASWLGLMVLGLGMVVIKRNQLR